MRRGCMVVGEFRCDACGKLLKHPARYLVVDEGNDVEGEAGATARYCVDCCLDKGYAKYRMEKGERILTFLEMEPESQ